MSGRSNWVLSASWSVVDKTNGDLLYVGSAESLRTRLAARSAHSMWGMVTPREEPRMYVALWFHNEHDIRLIERSMQTTCKPRWGHAELRLIGWTWQPPDELINLYALRVRLNERDRSLHTAGVYAWLYLPQGVDLKRVMVEGAVSRPVPPP